MTRRLDLDTSTDGQYVLKRDYLLGMQTGHAGRGNFAESIDFWTFRTASSTAHWPADIEVCVGGGNLALGLVSGYTPGLLTVVGNATGSFIQVGSRFRPQQESPRHVESVYADVSTLNIFDAQSVLLSEPVTGSSDQTAGMISHAPVDTPTILFSSPVDSVIQDLLQLGEDEVFEDGMLTPFSRGVAVFIELFGREAIRAIREAWISGRFKPEPLAEALRVAGRIEDPETQDQRLLLLAEALNHHSPRVRDAAVLGMASLEDKRALGYLDRAARQENLPELRELILQAMEGLAA